MDTRDNCSGKMPAKLRLASDTKSLDNSVTCDPGHRGPHRTRVTCHGSFIIDNCEVRREGRDNLLSVTKTHYLIKFQLLISSFLGNS